MVFFSEQALWISDQVHVRPGFNTIEIAANDLTNNSPIIFMPSRSFPQMGAITETVLGIVDRVTYRNPDNGWSVLRVLPFNNPHQQETVIVHQTKVFAGATMEFHGAWTVHPKFGRQFKAVKTVEKKPATAAALEKYLGSGLIKGVGPKTARKISSMGDPPRGDKERVARRIKLYGKSRGISLSDGQAAAITG